MQPSIDREQRPNQEASRNREGTRNLHSPTPVSLIAVILLACVLAPTLAAADCNCRCLVSLNPSHSGDDRPSQEVYDFYEIPEKKWTSCAFGRKGKRDECSRVCASTAAAEADRFASDDWWCETLNRPFDGEVTVYAQIGTQDWESASKRRVQCTRCCDCSEGVYDPQRQSCVVAPGCRVPGLPNGDKGGGFSAIGGVLFQDVPGAENCTVVPGVGPCEPPCVDFDCPSCDELTVTSSVNLQEGCDRTGAYNGKIELGVEGGTPPYTIRQVGGAGLQGLPSTGNSPFELSGIPIGTYRLEVRDSNGTVVTEEVDVEYRFSLALNATPASCATCSDGSAQVTVTGGTPPFTYRWNGSRHLLEPRATGLSPGVYGVTVADDRDCRRKGEVRVTWSLRHE